MAASIFFLVAPRQHLRHFLVPPLTAGSAQGLVSSPRCWEGAALCDIVRCAHTAPSPRGCRSWPASTGAGAPGRCQSRRSWRERAEFATDMQGQETAETAAAAAPALLWHFSQVFGEHSPGDEVAEGAPRAGSQPLAHRTRLESSVLAAPPAGWPDASRPSSRRAERSRVRQHWRAAGDRGPWRPSGALRESGQQGRRGTCRECRANNVGQSEELWLGRRMRAQTLTALLACFTLLEFPGRHPSTRTTLCAGGRVLRLPFRCPHRAPSRATRQAPVRLSTATSQSSRATSRRCAPGCTRDCLPVVLRGPALAHFTRVCLLLTVALPSSTT